MYIVRVVVVNSFYRKLKPPTSKRTHNIYIIHLHKTFQFWWSYVSIPRNFFFIWSKTIFFRLYHFHVYSNIENLISLKNWFFFSKSMVIIVLLVFQHNDFLHVSWKGNRMYICQRHWLKTISHIFQCSTLCNICTVVLPWIVWDVKNITETGLLNLWHQHPQNNFYIN